MRGRIPLALLAALGGCLVASPTPARDLDDGWLLPDAWAAALAAGASAPATAPRLVCGTGRLHALPELDQHGLGLRAAAAGLRLRADWRTMGGPAWRERAWRVEASAGRRATVGASWTHRRVETSGAPPWARAEAAGVLRLRAGGGGEAEVWTDPVSLTPGRAVSPLSPWLRARGLAGGAAWAVQVDRRSAGPPRWRVALAGRLADGVAAGVLAEPGTGTLGVTTFWRRGGLGVRTSHLTHPVLGTTHRWRLLLGGGPR